MALLLTQQNYSQGFLVDEELMAGVTEDPAQAGAYAAYVLRHTTGEYLGYQSCSTLDEALALINRIPREWAFEATKGCDGGKCAEGKCKGEGCRIFDKDAAAERQAQLKSPTTTALHQSRAAETSPSLSECRPQAPSACHPASR